MCVCLICVILIFTIFHSFCFFIAIIILLAALFFVTFRIHIHDICTIVSRGICILGKCFILHFVDWTWANSIPNVFMWTRFCFKLQSTSKYQNKRKTMKSVENNETIIKPTINTFNILQIYSLYQCKMKIDRRISPQYTYFLSFYLFMT